MKAFRAYDNDPLIEAKTNGSVKYLDMSIPQQTLRSFDWVMCMDILKYIPPNFEEIALFNMAHLARNGLAISWASPGEGKLDQVNERIRDYIENKLRLFCFLKDANLTKIARQYAFIPFVRTNVIIFLRKKPCSFKYIK